MQFFTFQTFFKGFWVSWDFFFGAFWSFQMMFLMNLEFGPCCVWLHAKKFLTRYISSGASLLLCIFLAESFLLGHTTLQSALLVVTCASFKPSVVLQCLRCLVLLCCQGLICLSSYAVYGARLNRYLSKVIFLVNIYLPYIWAVVSHVTFSEFDCHDCSASILWYNCVCFVNVKTKVWSSYLQNIECCG